MKIAKQKYDTTWINLDQLLLCHRVFLGRGSRVGFRESNVFEKSIQKDTNEMRFWV